MAITIDDRDKFYLENSWYVGQRRSYLVHNDDVSFAVSACDNISIITCLHLENNQTQQTILSCRALHYVSTWRKIK